MFVSGSGVHLIWVRNNLENFKKQLKALEEKVANDGIILNDAQVAALEEKVSVRASTSRFFARVLHSMAAEVPSRQAL